MFGKWLVCNRPPRFGPNISLSSRVQKHTDEKGLGSRTSHQRNCDTGWTQACMKFHILYSFISWPRTAQYQPHICVRAERKLHVCILHTMTSLANIPFRHIFLQLCTGGDLFTYITSYTDKGTRICEAEAKYLMFQMLQAIVYLHDKQIAHRGVYLNRLLPL